jgi:hypothetical protein
LLATFGVRAPAFFRIFLKLPIRAATAGVLKTGTPKTKNLRQGIAGGFGG